MYLKKILNILAFVFTIFMVVYGLFKGFNFTELIVNVIYFTVLVIDKILDLINYDENGDN